MRPLLLLASAVCLSAAEPVTFLRDVAPILNKASCTSGPCHGAAKGKNGFKLSLRGYDPQFDYEALLYDLVGPTLQPSGAGPQPDARQTDAAGAARRRLCGSRRIPAITRPSTSGLRKVFRSAIPRKDAVASLEVEPKEIVMPKPGEAAQVKVVAKFRGRRRLATSRRKRRSSRTRPTSRRSMLRQKFPVNASAKPRCWFAIRASSRRCPSRS